MPHTSRRAPSSDFGADYPTPTGLANLGELHEFLTTTLADFAALAPRHAATDMINESMEPPSLAEESGEPWHEINNGSVDGERSIARVMGSIVWAICSLGSAGGP